MTRTEFAKIMAYIDAATGKPLTSQALEVYFDLLGDLSYQVLLAGSKRILCERVWANFPQVGELRAAAVDAMQGQISALSPAQAWAIGWGIVKDTDPDVEGSFGRACRRKQAPAIVVETINAMGLPSLCDKSESVSVVRSQFLKFFEQLAARDRRRALLPAATVAAIEQPKKQASVIRALESIGQAVPQ